MQEKIKLLVAGGANFFSTLAFYFMAETIKTARDYINLKEGEKQ